MPAFTRLVLCAALFGCGTSTAVAPDASDSSVNVVDASSDASSGSTAWVAFAADFASGKGCGNDVGNIGCEIFRAKVSLPTFDLLSLEKITAGERPYSFPTISATGDRLYYRGGDGSGERAIYAWVNGKAVANLIGKGSAPALLADSASFIYVDDLNNLSRAWLSSDGTKVERSEGYGRTPPRGDPDLSPDGNFVLFNETGGDHGTSQARILNLASKAVVDVSQKDGSGHCAFSASGKLAVCDSRSAGALRAWDWNGTTASGERTFIADPSIDDVGDDYRSCRIRSVNYPAFCGDDQHVLVVVSCTVTLDGGESASAFSKLFLVDLSSGTPKYKPLSDQWSAQGGGKGTRAWSPICRVSL